MNEKDFLYGAHSGIQKAIRRGDLSLAKTCFDALWSEKEHRSWLQWRLPILVEEEMWYMLGELAEFLHEGTHEEKDWRRFIYQLVLCPKSKDPEALLYLALDDDVEMDHAEMKEARVWVNRLTDEKIEAVADELFDEMKAGDKFGFGALTKYELDAAKLMKFRTRTGGMAGDKQACMVAMILIAIRRLDKKQIKELVSASVNISIKKPRTVNLPWYCFDMHTLVGKWASSIFMKRAAPRLELDDLTKEKFEDIWFYFESAVIPIKDLKLVSFSPTQELLPTESMWWGEIIKQTVPFGENSAKEVKGLWDSKMKREIESIVNWCLEKRGEDS